MKMITKDIIASLKGQGFLTPRTMAFKYGCSKQTMYVFIRENKELFECSTQSKKKAFCDGNKIEKINVYKVRDDVKV